MAWRVEGLANLKRNRPLAEGFAQYGVLVEFTAEALAGIGAYIDDLHIGAQGFEVAGEIGATTPRMR